MCDDHFYYQLEKFLENLFAFTLITKNKIALAQKYPKPKHESSLGVLIFLVT